MVETLVSLVLLTVGMGSAVLTSIRCAELQRSTESMVRAHNACREVVEQWQGGGLAPRFQQYIANPTFPSGDLQIRVDFPTATLSQGLGGAIPATSRFRDNDGNGQVELIAGAADTFGLLPVRVTANRAGFRYQVDTLVLGP